ncbi:hypothetical protein D3C71_1411810 [compost metagenome]
MVDIDGGDHRHVAIDDVDRIQTPAEADFKHGQIQARLREQLQGGQRAVFEVGQRGIATRVLNGVEGRHQSVIGGVLAIDAHALVVAQQVR